MASRQQRKGFDRAGAPATGRTTPKPASRTRAIGIVIAVLVLGVVAIGGVLLATRGGASGSAVNISADQLASELTTHNFTLLDVKTPYIGEIDGTDLYIPYDQLTARASQLPTDKTAKIVVYCRSGNESAIAVKTLQSMGYTNLENLSGGMNAWQATGRAIVQKNRS